MSSRLTDQDRMVLRSMTATEDMETLLVSNVEAIVARHVEVERQRADRIAEECRHIHQKAEADLDEARAMFQRCLASENRAQDALAKAEGDSPSGFWSQREWEDWSNELTTLIPEDLIAGNPEGSQESIIEDSIRYTVAEVARLRTRWKETSDQWVRGRVEMGDLRRELDEARSKVERLRERVGPCICITAGPAVEGPDECCPEHGRPYDEWVGRADRFNYQYDTLREAVERVATGMISDSAHLARAQFNGDAQRLQETLRVGSMWIKDKADTLRALLDTGQLAGKSEGLDDAGPVRLDSSPRRPDCQCPPCPGRGNDGHGMTHCAECCFGTGVEADQDCPTHGERPIPHKGDDPMWSDLFEEVWHSVSYKPGYWLLLKPDAEVDGGRWYFQVEAERPDTYTGEPGVGRGGKAYLSPHMTRSELAQCAFGLFNAFEHHECREFFKFDGKRVFGPHFDVLALTEIADRTEHRDGGESDAE